MTAYSSLRNVKTLLVIICVAFAQVFPLYAQEEPFHEYIRPYQMANVEAVALTISPAYPTPGESVDVELRIRNLANQPAEDLMAVLYLGRQQVDVQSCNIAALDAATVKFSLKAPDHEIHTILSAQIDPDQILFEQDRLDNLISTEVVIANFLPTTDFAVSDMEVILPLNGPAMLQAVVYNNGPVAARTTALFTAGGEVIASRLTESLEPQSSLIVQVPLPACFYTSDIMVEVNPRYRSVERNPEDNKLSIDLRPSIDVRIEELSVAASQYEAGRIRQVTVNFRIINAGKGVISESFRTSIFPGVIDPDGKRSIYITTHGLEPGQVEYVSHTIEAAPGKFDIRVEADVDHIITEDDEENNFADFYFKNPTPNVGRWISIGPRLIKNGGLGAVGRLYQIAIHKSAPATLYVGAPSGSGGYKGGAGVWKTTNGGDSWKPIADGLPSLSIAAIAIDPSNASRVYVATHNVGANGAMIYRSNNAGTSWTKIYAGSLNLRGNSILLIDPLDSNRLFITSTSGVYRSTIGGTKWELVQKGIVDDLIMDPANPKRLYVAIESTNKSNYKQAGVYETTQSGAKGSWNKLTGCSSGKFPEFKGNGSVNLALSGKTLYASTLTASGFKLYRTTKIECQKSGQIKEKAWEVRWTSKTKLSNLYADPKDPKYLYASYGGGHFWVSTDSGKTFKQVEGKGPHADHHGFAVDPVNHKIIYTMTDGGIYRSSNRGQNGTWKFIGEGIKNVEIYDLAISKTDLNMVIAGTQDNGNIIYDGSTTWREIPGAEGDGWTVAIDPADAKKFYTMHQWAATLRRHSNGSVKCIACGLPPTTYQNNFHYLINPAKTSTLVSWCNNELWTAEDPNCTECPSPPNSDNKTGIAGAPKEWKKIWTVPTGKGDISRGTIDKSIDLYYMGTSKGDVYAGPKGANWKQVFTDKAFTADVNDIEIDPQDPKTVYVAFNASNAHRIYQLKRSSVTPDTKTISKKDITFDLPPNIRVYTIAVHTKKADTIYAGTNKGIYMGRSFDGGKTWAWLFYNNGMPSATHVSDLEIHPSNGVMRAATKGRGAYAVYTYSASVSVKITPGQQNISPGSSANYTVRVVNQGSQKDTWQLSLKGLEKGWESFSQSYITLNPSQEIKVTLTVKLPQCAIETSKTFTVTAMSTSDPTIYSVDQARLIIKVPDRLIAVDQYDQIKDNNSRPNATSIKLGPTKKSISTSLKNLTLHSSTDVDYFKIEFQSDSIAECIGGKSQFAPGSFLAALRPQYSPGSFTVYVEEEFCREMNIDISYAKANSNAMVTKKYRTAKSITIECPSGEIKYKTLYLAVRRNEKDKVRYNLTVSFSNWAMFLGKPLVDVGLLKYPRPPYLRLFDPVSKYHDYREFVRDFENDYPLYLQYLERFQVGNTELIQGQVARFAGQLEAAEQFFRQSLATFRDAGNESAQADVLRSMGQMYVDGDRFEDARESFLQASELHAASGNMLAYALDQVHLGELSFITGDLHRAMKIYNEAFRLQVEGSHYAGQYQNLINQFDGFMSIEKHSAAVACLILLEEITGKIDDPDFSSQLEDQVFQAKELIGENQYSRLNLLLQNQADAVRKASIFMLNRN